MKFSRKQTALILTGMTFFNYRQRGPTFMELGVLYGRVDIICLSMMSARSKQKNEYEIIFVEIKSCRADFLSDKKWGWYLNHPAVDRFEFICPEDAITLEDLNEAEVKNKDPVMSKVGLRVFTPEEIEHGAKRLWSGHRNAAAFFNGRKIRRSRFIEHPSDTDRYDRREILIRKLLVHASWNEWVAYEEARKSTLEGIGRMLKGKPDAAG